MEKRQKQRPRLATPKPQEITSVGFAQVARQLGESARALGLQAPAFRSPPRKPGLSRSISRRPDGSATVAVALRGRPAAAVVADMVEGVLAANRPAQDAANMLRDHLWAASQRPLAAALADGRADSRPRETGSRGQTMSGNRARRPVRERPPLRAIEGRAA